MPSIFNLRKVTVRHYLPCYLHNRFNRLYSDEIVHMLQLAKPKLILCDISVLETLNSALKELQMDRPVFAFDGRADGVRNVEVLFNETDVESFVYEFDILLMNVVDESFYAFLSLQCSTTYRCKQTHCCNSLYFWINWFAESCVFIARFTISKVH